MPFETSLSVSAPTMSAERPRYPDFIIGGAPKSGTTSLHFMLGEHPDIGIPDDEVQFFDADDPITQPNFFFRRGKDLDWFDVRLGNEESLSWYTSRFTPFADKALIGEDSTNYLFSEVAARRIHSRLPDVKLIFMLRDPVRRAWSAYWHELKMGRISCSFETAITRHPVIIGASTYASHLERWFNLFGGDRVKVLFFEDFVRDKQAALNATTDFLGAARSEIAAGTEWSNRTYYPLSPQLQFLVNRMAMPITTRRYRYHISGDDKNLHRRIDEKLYYWWFQKLNPLLFRSTRKPQMRDETRQYLTQHLSTRNAGLSALLGRDLSEIWPDFSG